MVRKVADNGTFYHEPPYTDEEEMELYRQMAGIKPDGTWAGGFTVVHRAPPAAAVVARMMRRLSDQGVNSRQCPSETISTAPSTTLIAVASSIA